MALGRPERPFWGPLEAPSAWLLKPLMRALGAPSPCLLEAPKGPKGAPKWPKNLQGGPQISRKPFLGATIMS